MAGMIYGNKIFVQKQFQLIAKELAGLKRFTAFTAILYIKAWFAAPSAIAAPDYVIVKMVLLKVLVSCLNSEIDKATSKKKLGKSPMVPQ